MSRSAIICHRCGMQLGWLQRGHPRVFRSVRILTTIRHDETETAFVCPACGAERRWEETERPAA